MSCNYTYKGKEYSTREELISALEIEQGSGSAENTFTISGDVEWQKTVIASEAEREYGTSEMVSFKTLENGDVEVSIDEQAINDIKSGEKRLLNSKTGEYESVDPLKKDNIEDFVGGAQEANIKAIGILLENLLSKGINNTTSPKDIETQLIKFATSLGFNIDTLTNYLKDKQLRDSADQKDIKGLVDMFEKTIALADRGDIDTLTEEIAHLAIEYNLDQEIVAKMIAKVDQTTMYQLEATKYRQAYASSELSETEVETKVRKEVLGKILKEKVQDQFSTEGVENLAEIGIFSQLQTLWERFLDLFKKTDANKKFFKEFGRLLDEMAFDISKGDSSKLSLVDSKEVYYNLDSDQKSIQDRLLKHGENLKADYRNIVNDLQISKAHRKVRLTDFREQLMQNQFAKALNSFISIIAEDISSAQRKIETSKLATGGVLTSESFNSADVDTIQSLLNNFDRYSDVMTSEVKGLVEFLTPVEQQTLLNRLVDAQSNYTSIKADLSFIAQSVLENEMKQDLSDAPLSERVKESLLTMLKASKIDDIWVATKHLGSIKNTNPILKAVYWITEQADEIVRKKHNIAADRLEGLQDKNPLSKEGKELLYDGDHIAMDIHLMKAKADFQKDMEEATADINAAIEKEQSLINGGKQDRAILIELEKKLYAKEEEVRAKRIEREFLPEYYRELGYMSQEARGEIINRSVGKQKILAKYKKTDGSVDITNILEKDYNDLKLIDETYKAHLSEWEADGSQKTGTALRVAKELQEYANSFAGREYELDPNKSFEADRAAEEKKIEDAKTPAEKAVAARNYDRWLEMNAVMHYSEDVQKILEEERGTTESTFKENQLLRLEDLAREVGLPTTASEQEVYEALLDKRKKLVAPYKKQGKIGEIDGYLLDKNKETSAALRRVYSYLDMFNKKYTSPENNSYEFVSVGNDAFYREKERLKNDRLGWEKFKIDAGVRIIRGEEVPTVYHYTAFKIKKDGKFIEKEPQPNFKYTLQADNSKMLNPNYRQDLKGKTIQYNTTNYPELINKEFLNFFGIDSKGQATKNLGDWEIRQAILELKEKADIAYNLKNSYFYLPQKAASSLKEAIGYKTDKKGLIKGKLAKDYFLDSDEEDVGDVTRMVIPKRYIKPLKDGPEAISRDIMQIYLSYYQRALEYEEKTKVLPKIRLFQAKLNKTHIGETREGASSNISGMLNEFVSDHFYGNKIDTIHISKNFVGSGRDLVWGKVAKKFYNHVRNTALMSNLVTPMVGMVSAMTYLGVEATSGKIVNKKSTLWAAQEFGRNFIGLTLDSGAINPKSHLKNLLRYSGVTVSIPEIQAGIDQGRMYRGSGNLGYKLFEIGSIPSGAMALLSTWDAYRLVDGQFINEGEFSKGKDPKEAAKEWDDLRAVSYYNFIKQDADGNKYLDYKAIGLTERQGELLEVRMNRMAQTFHASMEGAQDPLDKAAIYRNPITAFLGMFKGFYWNFLQNRFKERQEDWNTNQEDEGSYRTIGRLFIENLKADKTNREKVKHFGEMAVFMLSAGHYARSIEGLEEFEKANIKRMSGDLVAYSVLMSLAIMLQADGDDDDTWLEEYLSYVSIRAFGEQASIMGKPSETLQMLKSPVAGVDLIESLFNIPALMTSPSKQIKSGDYKGYTQLERTLWKATFLKNIYHAKVGYAGSDAFFRTKLYDLPSFYEEDKE